MLRSLEKAVIGLALIATCASPFMAQAQEAAIPPVTPDTTTQDTPLKDAPAPCANNPICSDPKTAFDITKNPALKDFTYSPETKFDANKYPIPTNIPDEGDMCVPYVQHISGLGSFGATAVNACLVNGQFLIFGTIAGGAGGTGDVTTGVGTTNTNTGEFAYKPTTATGDMNCTFSTMALNILSWPGCLLKGTALILLGFTNVLLGIAGTLFNWAVVKTVFQFATFIGNAPGLLVAWHIARDLGNIIVLFGFILIGLGTILDVDRMPNKKMLPGLIIFAILINFSLFASEAVIDVSNAFSSVMYSQANAAPCLGKNVTDQSCVINVGIAGHIMQSTGLSAVLSTDKPDVPTTTLLMLILFSLIGAVVMFAGAIMILIRAVLLTFLMMISPIGFAGMVIPQMKGGAKMWWDALIRESFFAPVYILLILMSLKVADGFSGAVATVSAAASGTTATAAAGTTGVASLTQTLSSGDTSAMGNIMVYFAVIGFLVASLVIARKMGAAGSSFAVNSASRMTFGSMNLATQGSARFARFGIQRLGGGETAVGRAAIGMLRPVEGGLLDPRKLGVVQSGLKAAGATKAAAPQDSYGKFTGGFSEMNPLNPNSKRAKEERKRQEDELATIRQGRNRAELRRDINAGALTPDTERILAGLSAKQLEEMPEIKRADPMFISALSPDQFEGLIKSEALSGATKNALSNARYGDVLTRSNDEIRQMSNKDLQQLAKSNNELFQQLVQTDPLTGRGRLTDDQMDNLKKSDALTRSQQAFVRAQTPSGRIEAAVAAGDHLTAQRLSTAMSPKNKVKLSGGTLASPGVWATFNSADLGKIMEDGKLTPDQRREIRDNVIRNPAAPAPPPHANRGDIDTWIAGNPIAAAYWNAL